MSKLVNPTDILWRELSKDEKYLIQRGILWNKRVIRFAKDGLPILANVSPVVKEEAAAVVKKLRKSLDKAEASMPWYEGSSIAEVAKKYRDLDRAAAKHKKEKQQIEKRLIESSGKDLDRLFCNIQTGANVGSYDAKYSDHNGIECVESHERYSSRCRYLKTTRSFTLHIKRGWDIKVVGGLITFIKGKLDRRGVACEWVTGAYSSFATSKGFLVRGEHIVAKSLNEAKRINEEHRSMILARLLNQRKKQHVTDLIR